MGQRGRTRQRVARDVAIALPPVVEIGLFVAGMIVSVDAVGESAESWAPLSWPLYAVLGTFPFAVGAFVAAVRLRGLEARTPAICFAALSAAVGVIPFAGVLSILVPIWFGS
ncbi:hypothetical protein [Curtobacterium oceanosedimentum]|uniref:hypothetical protein n=1 Tax=Curtobacterium oceanosedimentum TaxID=465820 RepID=UPI001CE096DA|nr:hypothetical protein [Curtobacterium oceanosedimentum]MCA5923165.1 hypothetical protein [Curtobacterium oceanosedimentum]